MSDRQPIDWSAYNGLDAGPRVLPRSNRDCPECGQPCFMVTRSLDLPDGSTWRERRCLACGHVAERLAPPERPIESEANK